ncbi:MAG: peptidylprolyl isomerase [Deltaproteobacteria bacterium]|jgi:peptidyl-prolyl cis-trans isomerase C|nr:peptidylprolyl isomerase [Deltaproteobacteria bacterium]
MQMKWFRWFFILLTAVSLVYIAMPVFAEEKKIPDGAVATVNGVAITQDDFDKEMARVSSQFARGGRSLTESQLPDIKNRVLKTLINRELLYQESQNKGIKVEDAEVNQQVDVMKKRFPNEDEFKTALLEMKISEAELKSQIRKGMAIQQFVDKDLVQDVKVSETEVKDFYKKNPDMFKQAEQVKASHILIKVDTQADKSAKDQANKKIKEIQKKLEDNADFAVLAKEYSEGPSSANGGDLGYFERGRMVKPFEDAAFKLKPGEVSGMVETPFGYHLIKVVDKKPESVVSFEEAKGRIAQYLGQKIKEKVLERNLEDMRKKAVIKTF